MDIATALDDTMTKRTISDEHVALEVGVRAKAVRDWRLGNKVPSAENYQRLRTAYPDFAERIDAQMKVEKRRAAHV